MHKMGFKHLALLLGALLLIGTALGEEEASSNCTEVDEETQEAIVALHANLNRLTAEFASLQTDWNETRENITQTSEFVTELKEEIKNNKTRTQLDKLLKNPRARLYTGVDFYGDFEDYEASKPTYEGGCYTLSPSTSNKVKSVETFGACVRLFFVDKCHGWSQAVHPTSGNAADIRSPSLSQIKSIGPCLSNEFDDAILDDHSLTKNPSDAKHYFPDLLDLTGTGKFALSTKLPDDRKNSFKNYLLGASNRVEYVRASVNSFHLNQTTKATLTSTTTPTPATTTDDMTDATISTTPGTPATISGHVISPKLSGPDDKAYNSFSMGAESLKEWDERQEEVETYLTANPSHNVKIYVNILYPDEVAAIPSSFTYYFSFNGEKRVYGLIRNSA